MSIKDDVLARLAAIEVEIANGPTAAQLHAAEHDHLDDHLIQLALVDAAIPGAEVLLINCAWSEGDTEPQEQCCKDLVTRLTAEGLSSTIVTTAENTALGFALLCAVVPTPV